MPESAIPAYIISLIRHFEDLRDGTHGGSASRNKSCADLGNPIPEECCQSIQLYLAVGPLTRKLYRSETRSVPTSRLVFSLGNVADRRFRE